MFMGFIGFNVGCLHKDHTQGGGARVLWCSSGVYGGGFKV